jgi:hypothetical protein
MCKSEFGFYSVSSGIVRKHPKNWNGTNGAICRRARQSAYAEKTNILEYSASRYDPGKVLVDNLPDRGLPQKI